MPGVEYKMYEEWCKMSGGELQMTIPFALISELTIVIHGRGILIVYFVNMISSGLLIFSKARVLIWVYISVVLLES